MPPSLHQVIEQLARLIELAGVGVIVIALCAATVAFLAIRTFLSFALETEIEGRWPWLGGEKKRDGLESQR